MAKGSTAIAPTANGKGATVPTKTAKKSYASEGVKDNDIFLLPGRDYQILIALTLLGLVVRVFRIYQPDSVVFDEVHFGGFASKYVKGQFFMDVHPPLAKLLITLAGWLAGYDGAFDFKEIGKDYVEAGVPYVAMRMLPALLGVSTIPVMFLTLKAFGCQTLTAAMGATMIIFENALVTQSRLILLDSPLIACTAFTALAFTCFNNQQELGPSRQFKPLWWFWLGMTGLGLGATASVKWVGLFTIAWVGSITVVQLWTVWGDYQNVTPRLFAKHFVARVLNLILVPMMFYMLMFMIHFACLVNPGEGDGFMSSEFQATLNSKGMQSTPADVVMGSRVTIRHWNTQGGYLHSHNHMYPTGSKQQQVTLYPHRDENNMFLLENQTQPLGVFGEPINGTLAWDNRPPTQIKNGAIIRLYHTITGRRIHSHDVRPPVSEVEWQNEVSCYGYEGFEGDANDLFRVEIVKDKSERGRAREVVRTIETKFRLIHVMTGCALFSHKKKLPTWGFEQQEVTCARQGTLPNSIWYVEQNQHPQLSGDDVEKVNYRDPGFMGKFLELQKVMWTTNAGLTDSHAWDSRPYSWPLLLRGINFWGKDHRQVYLLGNPVIWWTSTGVVLGYMGLIGIAALRFQRGYLDYTDVRAKRFTIEVGMAVLGWAFHYFPFYLMARQLFLHHYLPALYFAIMALCQVFDHVTARFTQLPFASRPAIARGAVAAFLAVIIMVFMIYSPLVYGNAWTKGACQTSRIMEDWDYECNNFLTSLDEYKTLSRTSASSAVPVANPLQVPAEEVEQVVTPQANEAKESDTEASKKPQVDAEGNSQYVPDHPEIDLATPKADDNGGAEKGPASANADRDIQKEEQAERNKQGKPKPASEKKAATPAAKKAE